MPYTVYSEDGRRFVVPTKMLDDVLSRGYSLTNPRKKGTSSPEKEEQEVVQQKLFETFYDEEG